MSETVRIGVIGTGIGVTHIEGLRKVEGAEVVGVCSAQLERAESVAARFGISLATDDYRELLVPEIDAVVVTAPPGLHASMTLDAIAAGKHVFCEKPLASSLSEARAMRDAAREAGVVHAINFQMRYTPEYARAHAMQAEGYLGRITMLDARISMNPVAYLRYPEWSSSKIAWFTDAGSAGGLLTSSAGPHLADFMLWYGGPIVEVAARVAVTQPRVTLDDGRIIEVTSEDAFLALVRYASGALGTIRGTPVAYQGGWFTLELHGTGGSLMIDDNGLRGATASDSAPAPIPLPAGAPHDRVAIAAAFVEAVRTGGPAPSPNFDDGVAAQAVLEAALAAARCGEWVAVEAT